MRGAPKPGAQERGCLIYMEKDVEKVMRQCRCRGHEGGTGGRRACARIGALNAHMMPEFCDAHTRTHTHTQ